jgi:hypothetical protein
MPTFQYEPYYQYKGPTRAEPAREELSPEDVAHRLELFANEIGAYFEDVTTRIDFSAGGILSVTTDLSPMDCDDRVKRCLNSLDLYARKLSR